MDLATQSRKVQLLMKNDKELLNNGYVNIAKELTEDRVQNFADDIIIKLQQKEATLLPVINMQTGTVDYFFSPNEQNDNPFESIKDNWILQSRFSFPDLYETIDDEHDLLVDFYDQSDQALQFAVNAELSRQWKTITSLDRLNHDELEQAILIALHDVDANVDNLFDQYYRIKGY